MLVVFLLKRGLGILEILVGFPTFVKWQCPPDVQIAPIGHSGLVSFHWRQLQYFLEWFPPWNGMFQTEIIALTAILLKSIYLAISVHERRLFLLIRDGIFPHLVLIEAQTPTHANLMLFLTNPLTNPYLGSYGLPSWCFHRCTHSQ